MNGTSVDIAFLALARDCAATIPNFLGLISALNAAGTSTLAIVGENGSRDGTRRQLVQAAGQGLLRVEDTRFMEAHTRFKRMALGRQALANCLAGTGIKSKIVCIVDLDDPMSAPIDVESLRRAMSRLLADDRLFALAATSRPAYYDLIAFDDGKVSFDHLVDEIRGREANPLRYYTLFSRKVYPSQIALTSNQDIHCVSAFNGMCLYRSHEYEKGSYCQGSKFDICEHLNFNRSVAAASGKLMLIDPHLRVHMPAEHGQKSFLAFWAQRARKLGVRLKRRVVQVS